jgi:pyruvate dehydrogenase E2 component (dihydrolipoamide acetyltransferase)
MAFEFRLPDIGEGVVEGEVVKWLVKVGDIVREDQPMVEVMTDKATVEIPSPKAGRIASITAPEGKTCKVGQVMVTIETGNGATAAPVEQVRPEPTHRITTSGAGTGAGAETGTKVLATPATRKLARDLGVDLSRVRPTGDNGRVTSEDVRAAAGGEPAAPRHITQEMPALAAPSTPVQVHIVVGDERLPFRGVRKKIAENMARSKRTAAHFTYVDECDVTELVALRNRARKRAEERGVKLSFLPFIVKAVVAGLKKYPIVNSSLDEERGEIVLHKRYNIGVAAASEAGLIVPVLKDADQKSLFDLARELGDLSEKAKTGKATRDELTGSTFTISSLGALGGVLATPIINHPEVAVLGVHKIKPTPVVRDGQIVVREMTNFSISLDHRVVDGYEGALFLQHVIELLSDPTLMFLELV